MASVKGIDTNLLLRHLTADDPVQSPRARALFRSAAGEGIALFVSTISLCELAWSLAGKRYRFDRAAIAAALEEVLESPVFVIEDRALVVGALSEYRAGSAGFADYLLGRIHRHAGCTETFTLDRALAQSAGFTLLGDDTYPTGGAPPSTINEAL